MTVLSPARCKSKFPKSNPQIELCAGDNEGKDTCLGDSGGPLVAFNEEDRLWYSIGVTSYGNDCTAGSVYARSAGFIDWIKNIVANN